MLGLPSFLYPPEMLKKMRQQEEDHAKREAARRIPFAVPWSPDLKWERELNLQAKTWPKFSLFDVPPCRWAVPDQREKGTFLLSPGGGWMYSEVVWRKGMQMNVLNISKMKQGSVLFDKDILVPRVHRYVEGWKAWDEHPFMSITPQELMTLRTGTKRAKGRTFVVGLGLGYQLIEVSKSPKVKELVLIEQSRDLVDWILPKVRPFLARKLDEVIIGDAKGIYVKTTAKEVVTYFAERQQWKESTVEVLLTLFIDEKDLASELHQFFQRVADGEEDEGGEG